jgi:DNA replication protein DnaC
MTRGRATPHSSAAAGTEVTRRAAGGGAASAVAAVSIEALCKRLHLANAPRIYRDLAARAEQEQWAYRDLLAVLLAEEVAHRQQTRIQRLTRRARFPFLKTIDEFDFTYQSTLRLAMLGSYLSPDLVTDGRCLVLTGKTGRGKTHLAIAIAYRAIQNGFEALFTTAAALVEELSVAAREGRLAKLLPTYTRPAVLVIDELGYLTYGPDAANVLFHVVNERHLRKRPMIFTTNKPLPDWGRVLHDPTSPRRSSTAFSNADGSSSSTAPPCAPSTSGWTNTWLKRHHRYLAEFPESPRQSFRNPQRVRCARGCGRPPSTPGADRPER